MPTKGDTSMYETVKDHEERIQLLEDADVKHDERIKNLEDSTIKLENTIMTENRDTRKTMTQQTEKLFEIVESAMGYQTTQVTQTHELKMLKWNTLSTVFLKITGGIFALLSSGGVLYFAIQKILGE